MSENLYITGPEDRIAAIKSLEMTFDYAIVEAAQLRLPVVVFLLRVARLELDQGRNKRAVKIR